MPAIIEVFTTPNKKTKSGEPKRWRWRITNDDHVSPTSHTFPTVQKCFINIARAAAVPVGALLRVEGKDDVPWVMS
jgi:hypothetical protein